MNPEAAAQSEPLLAELTLSLVLKDDDRYTLVPEAAQALQRALDGVFASEALNAEAEIRALVKLGGLFQRKPGAAEVVNGILEALAREPRALAVLGVRSGRRVRELEKRFSRFAGGDGKTSAPVYGAKAPEGTVSAAQFLDPGRERKRAPASASARRGGATPPKKRGRASQRRYFTC